MPPAKPVTVLIRRQVKPSREADCEAWLQRLKAEARTLPGYLGVTTQWPASTGPREYFSAARFDSLQSLQAFEASELKARHLAEVEPLMQADAAWEKFTGLEFWFSAPPGTVMPQPSRPRMALAMIAVVFTLVLVIGSAVNTTFAALPLDRPCPVRLLVTIAIEVVLMTYWLMPALTRRLARWICPSPTSA